MKIKPRQLRHELVRVTKSGRFLRRKRCGKENFLRRHLCFVPPSVTTTNDFLLFCRQVKDRDPTADCSSEDENLAAMLAFGDDSDLEEGGEEHETSQEVSHGYNVDGFVVHDDDAAEVWYPKLQFPIPVVPPRT